MQRIVLGLIVLVGLWLYSGGDDQLTDRGGPNGGDRVIDFAPGDPDMSAAITAARESMPLFLDKNTDSAGNAMGNTSVKVAFDIGNEGAEIIWVSAFTWDGGANMTGRLANQPNYMEGLNAGDPVDFTTDMIRDWSFVAPDGTMWGHYTTRVIVPQLDADTQTALNAMLSADPVPSTWN